MAGGILILLKIHAIVWTIYENPLMRILELTCKGNIHTVGLMGFWIILTITELMMK